MFYLYFWQQETGIPVHLVFRHKISGCQQFPDCIRCSPGVHQDRVQQPGPVPPAQPEAGQLAPPWGWWQAETGLGHWTSGEASGSSPVRGTRVRQHKDVWAWLWCWGQAAQSPFCCETTEYVISWNCKCLVVFILFKLRSAPL